MMMLPKDYKNRIQNLIAQIAWLQWNRLGINATGKSCRYSVDIENFLIMAAIASRHDARLFEGVVIWSHYYRDVIQKERLSNLIKSLNNAYVARFWGALAENFGQSTWRNFVSNCRKVGSDAPLQNIWQPTIPVTKDHVHSVCGKWGLLFPDVAHDSRKKLKDHDEILKNNAVLAYRYCLEPSNRADILYLFGLSAHLKTRKEWDYLTCLRLARILGVHDSTVYRIQRDFEKAGLLRFPRTEEHKLFMWTWETQSEQFAFSSKPLEKGILNWTTAVPIICELINVIDQAEGFSSEITAKVHIHEVQMKWWGWLNGHGLVPDKMQFGTRPLSEYPLKQMAYWIHHSIKHFIQELGG